MHPKSFIHRYPHGPRLIAMSGYWDPHIERMPLEDLHSLQEDRLKSITRYVYDHSSFYRQRFKEGGVEPDDIKQLSDLTKLPFTKKGRSAQQLPNRHVQPTNEPHCPVSRF